MSSAEAFYVTTPIYYVNDVPHIGHAYTTLACDAIARFARLDGREARFLTGTDEHGQKVEKAAAQAGLDPQAFTDRVSERFRELARVMKISNDDFIRTTEGRHKAAVQALWRELRRRDQIYLGTYAGWYSVRDEAFYAESEIEGGLAPSGAPVEWVEEPSYFFRLSAWQEPLLRFYEERPDFILPPSRRNEVIRFVEGGLQDLSVSRTSFRWGIPVPDDPGHVIYVWLDALTNYMSALGYPDLEARDFRRFWPADVHVVGKDILRFHAVYWPAFLLAAEIEPPRRVVAHGWWTVEGQKISKSLGNVIDPWQLIDTYGLDQTRYFLLREVPFGNDGDFSHAAMINRMNRDLANDYGNLVQRVLSMVQRYCEGRVPEPGPYHAEDEELAGTATRLIGRVRSEMANQALSRALEAIFEVIGAANRYVDAQAPWALRKDDPSRAATVLYVLAETIRHIAVPSQAFLPDASGRILDQLAVAEDARSLQALSDPSARLRPGTPLPKPAGVFPRYAEPGEAKPG
jgi:methionyl-tRNA synthetase